MPKFKVTGAPAISICRPGPRSRRLPSRGRSWAAGPARRRWLARPPRGIPARFQAGRPPRSGAMAGRPLLGQRARNPLDRGRPRRFECLPTWPMLALIRPWRRILERQRPALNEGNSSHSNFCCGQPGSLITAAIRHRRAERRFGQHAEHHCRAGDCSNRACRGHWRRRRSLR